MSPVTSTRVAVIQDVQTLCIHYTDCWLPPLCPPFCMAPQLSQSDSQMRVSVRVCLLQALIWCYYSADGETGSRSQELLVDSTCLRPGLVTSKHILNKHRAENEKGVETVFAFFTSPTKITNPLVIPPHTLVFVLQRLVIPLSHPLSSHMFLIHFSETQLHM